MLRKVKIYGHLEKKFGRDHEYDVSSISEAIKLLTANYKDFKEELRKGYYRIVRGSDLETGDGLFEEEITMQFGNGDFHIVPVLEGATDQAGKGWGQIIAGVILLVVSYFVPVIAPYTVPMGIGLIMSGIATLMMPSIPDTQDDRDEREASYTFNGAVNRIEQGSAIPICYGRFGLGSIVVASSLVAKDT
jgi:predicted phage tail protein